MVQSSKAFPYGLMFGSRGADPTTSIDIAFVYDTKLASVAVTMRENFPTLLVTVPEIKPFESINRPFGSPFELKVRPPVPPAAAIVAV